MKRLCTAIFTIVITILCNNTYAQLWKQYSDSAKAFSDQKKTDKAIEYYYKAKEELQKDSMWTNSHAVICHLLGLLYYNMGQYAKTELLWFETKRILERVFGKESPDYARGCNNLGVIYMDLGQYEKAEALYVEAAQIKEKLLGNEHPDYASSCINLGNIYLKIGQYEKAEPLYLEARHIFERVFGKESPEYARCCNNLASLYRKMGFYEKAESLYLEAKNIREKVLGKENPEFAESCGALAGLYLRKGQYEKAEPLFLEEKKIKEKVLGKEHPDYAGSCNDLAVLYKDMGQIEKAELLYIEAKNIREKVLGKEHPDYASSCINLGNIYFLISKYEKAEILFLEAKSIREKVLGKEHPDYARGCNTLAGLFMIKGQYEKAESFYLEAKKIHEKIVGKEHPDYAIICKNLADLYYNLGQYEKSEQLYLEVKIITEKSLGKEHPDFTSCCNRLADLYWHIGQYKKAEIYYVEALHLQQRQIQKIFQFTSEAEKQSYLKESKADNNAFFSFNYADYSSNRQGATYDIVLLIRNLILSSSQQLRSAIYNTNDTITKNKYSTWINSREQLSLWYTKPIAERPAYVKDLEERANTLEKQLTRLSSDFKKQHEKQEPGWKNIQQSLKSTEAAIEFVEFPFYNGKRWTDSTYYIALVLRKDKPEPELVKLFEKKQLDTLLNNPENLTTDNRINALYTGNKSLYNLTWKPLEKYLTGISKVYFASAGNLFKISFAALPVNDKQVLGDKYQLIQLNTTASVTDNEQSILNTTDKIQLYGGIRYDADSATLKQAVALHKSNTESTRSLPADLTRGEIFKYLPGTQQETEEIQKQAVKTNVPFTILSGTNATEESVKALTGKNSPSVLHIATHGFFFPDPKDDKRDSIQRKFETSGKAFKQSDDPLFRSGLLFAGANNAWQGKPIEGIEDGILTAYEVSNLYLPNTKLVVLSACETALGDIQGSEGVYGLQRAFKMAGVQNLVMSLWKVPDAETAEFMQIFYKNLFAKQTISNAFYNAQQVMKDKYRAEPYKWAAWVLVR